MEASMTRFLNEIISDSKIKSNIETCDLIIDDIMEVLNSYNYKNVIFELKGEGGIAKFRENYNCNSDGEIFDIYIHNMDMSASTIQFMMSKYTTIADINRMGIPLVNSYEFSRLVVSQQIKYPYVQGMLSIKEFILYMIDFYYDEIKGAYNHYYIKFRVCMKLSEKLNINAFMW